jgi:CheY-like chemotaxis protein
MKILIVDDVDYIRKSVTKVLTDNQFDCDSCANGKEALEKLDEQKYDLIITDLVMPEVDGFEFIDRIRNHQNSSVSRTPVLAISGGSKTIDSQTALTSIKQSADGLLQKPFSKTDLIEAVAKIIGRTK